MKEAIAIILIAVWLTGGIFTMLVATQNFYIIDRLIDAKPNPVFSSLIESIGELKVRELLRYLSSEMNRLYFKLWNGFQIVFGLLLVWLVSGSHLCRIRYGSYAVLTLTVVLAFAITPSLLSVGRELDFVPRDPVPPELKTFGILHALYTLLEFLKLGISGMLAFWIQRK